MAYAKKMQPKNSNYKTMLTPMGQCVIDTCVEDDDMIDDDECPNDPDLLLLRDAAADERNAIAFYLRAAHVTCLDSLFLDVAEDEMHHFIETMQLVSSLDPIQAERFEEQGLTVLTTLQRLAKKSVKWMPPNEAADEAEVIPPSLEEMDTVDILTKAINDELMAINKYQRYMEEAVHPEVKALFCHLMNEEKEHVAEFIKALWCITHEPLPPEND